MLHKIDFYQKVEGKPQAAFIIFFATDGKPWSSYKGTSDNKTDLMIPTCLMINRADGCIGFIGGKVEEGETLEQAAIREVMEEVGHSVQSQLKPVVAHDLGPITTHAFAAKLDYKQLRKIQEDAINAPHFGSEVTGIFLPHLIDYQEKFGRGGGIIELLKNSMAPSVREELIHFLLKESLFTKQQLENISDRANYLLDDLLK